MRSLILCRCALVLMERGRGRPSTPSYISTLLLTYLLTYLHDIVCLQLECIDGTSSTSLSYQCHSINVLICRVSHPDPGRQYHSPDLLGHDVDIHVFVYR